MTVKRSDIDNLNAVLSVEIKKDDYTDKVEKVIKNYAKNAMIPGFRKGTVPLSLVKKQYGKAIVIEEVNKLVQENLNQYIQEQKLALLGSPLPKINNQLNLDADLLTFDFEIGISPNFEVNLQGKNKITRCKVVADDNMISNQVMRIRKQYGKLSAQTEIHDESDITGTFINVEKNINSQASLSMQVFADQSTRDLLMGKKVGDTIVLKTKGLFEDEHKLMDYLKISHDEVHGLDIEVNFTVEEITFSEPAELDQTFFDKLFGPENISSEADLRQRIKTDAERQFNQQADQKFLNDVTDWLLSSVSFDLPADFLKRWLQTAGEKPLSAEEAASEYIKSERGLRYQLIEGKIMQQYNIQVEFHDLKNYAADMIRKQMAQFGQLNPTEDHVEQIVARVLSNQDEARRLSEQLMSEKMLELFKNQVSTKEKEVSYDEFVKELYGE